MIRLNSVKPAPIQDRLLHISEVWDTDLSFEKGKRYLISAASGKGKSTLLHVMYGLRTDYTGEIQIDKKSVHGFNLEDWAMIRQQRLSLVFQDLRLFPDLTGLENIQLKKQLTPNYTPSISIEIMATQLGMQDLLLQTCGTMSYGQQQRIAIIRALQQPFDFLLLDEPFSHLDDDNIKAASKLIDAIVKEQQAGFILVSLGDTYHFEYDYILNL